MATESESGGRDLSAEAKNFYSSGAVSALGSIALVAIIWAALKGLSSRLGWNPVGLIVAAIVVYGFAFFVPEPPGYTHEGKRRITGEEAFYGFINTFVV